MKNEVINELRGAIKDSLKSIVDGQVEDLDEFASEITADAIEAMKLPPERREFVLAEIVFQLKAIAERNRLRLIADSWAEAQKIMAIVLSVGVRVGVAALAA